MPEIKVRLPDIEEQQELRALVIDGLELVGWFATLPEDETDNDLMLTALQGCVSQLREQADFPIAEFNNYEDLAYALGSLFGSLICDSHGWHWCHLTLADGNDVWAVASNEGHHCCYPHHLLHDVLIAVQDSRLKLLFNRLAVTQELPSAAAHQYLCLA